MPDTQTITLDVLRYEPAADARPRVQSYAIEFTPDMSVLQGLQHVKDFVDGSLTFRWSCRMAICGSCGMMIGGKPRLACRTFLRDCMPGPIAIEPLAHFPIERDLVVDAAPFVGKLEAIRPWIEPAAPRSLA